MFFAHGPQRPTLFPHQIQGKLSTLNGQEIDYSKAEEPKVNMDCELKKALHSFIFQNELGVLATLRHHGDFVGKLENAEFVKTLVAKAHS